MNLKRYILTFCLISLFGIAFAGPPPPPPSGGTDPTCWPPPCVPIDGGISLLIAAGALYGGRKLYIENKNKD